MDKSPEPHTQKFGHSPAKLFNPHNRSPEQTWTGFSWPCLLFGVLWFLYKRMYGWALIAFLASVITGGLAWFVFPFFANGLHQKDLVQRGYLTQEQAGV